MWNLEKIKQHIADGIEENVHLDYKSSGSLAKTGEKKKEISKNVSAFANSDGGIIIYGVKEFDEKGKNHLPEEIDPIDGKLFTKEWLEQIINSTIFPKIHDIVITPIQVENPKVNSVIYVVEIPKSNTAHQCIDKRYYRRFNFLSTPMDDWEIKDIINRLSKTDVQLYFETDTPKEFLKDWPPLPTRIKFEIWAKNSGNKVVKYLDCFINGDYNAARNIVPYRNGDFEKHCSNIVEREVTIGKSTFINSSERVVILPNTSRKIGELEVLENFIKENNELTFQISTEDNVKYLNITGQEMIK